ncbi:hypothetical protein LTS08_006367 [Lithohypha guttulata]|nr:hypothetical protein LTS08_006367 [Lithohypha guttulata]
MAFYQAMPWHEGEEKIHKLTRLPSADNPTHPMLPPMLAARISRSPTIALGTINNEGRVWCTVWGGDVPIAQQVARGGVLGIRTQVDASFDPVVQALYGGRTNGEVVQNDPKAGRMVSGLSIHLEERDRVKLFGRMLAGSVSVEGAGNADANASSEGEESQEGVNGTRGTTGNAQLVLHITQSLGNCPKYLNKKHITSYATAKPRLLSDSPILSVEAISHIQSADTIFIASAGPEDMDCNIRGGPPGFIRIIQQETQTQSVLIWPEYSGNNLYQTLGNLTLDARAGIVVPNFQTGTILYLSGTTEVLIDESAASVISKTRLAVRFTVTAARFVADGLCFRGTLSTSNKDVSSSNPAISKNTADGMSPYNPRVRYLISELDEQTQKDNLTSSLPPNEYRNNTSKNNDTERTAALVKKTKLTPTITKYRFRLASDSGTSTTPLWQPGQYVILDFSEELYMGYSHMRDDDPTSLNDDFIRTFTVASSYVAGRNEIEFEIIVRNVGSVTRWLSWQNDRGMLGVGVKGFAGTFRFEDLKVRGADRVNVFVAAGVGITPLLGQVRKDEEEEAGRLIVLWTLHVRDIGLVAEVLKVVSGAVRMQLFITGTSDIAETSTEVQLLAEIESKLSEGRVTIQRRRMGEGDLIGVEAKFGVKVANWYLCTTPAMRKQVQEWLPGKVVDFENFDY